MATVNSVNYAKTLTVPQTLIETGELSGEVKCFYDKYVAAGAIPISTIIKMPKLPEGARLVKATLKFTDLGTTGKLSVGVESDDNMLFTNVDVATAAGTVVSTDVLSKLAATEHVIITATEATDAAGTIELAIFYVVD